MGDDRRRNGKHTLTPQQMDDMWSAYNKKTDIRYWEHMAIKGDGSKSWPGIKHWDKPEIEQRKADGTWSCYGSRKRSTTAEVRHPYDRLFKPDCNYNPMTHRDDRRQRRPIGLAIHDEENKKAIPTLGNSNYGHRVHKNLEPLCRSSHVRVAHAIKGFLCLRRTGLSVPPTDKIVLPEHNIPG